MSLEIIWASGSPYSWTVLLALEIKKQEYKSTLIELLKGEGRTPDFLQINPRGKVPVLKDGDTCVYESLAILSYLDRKYPEIPILGDTPEKNAQIMKVISEYFNYMSPMLDHIISSAFWTATPNQSELEQVKHALFYEMAIYEKTLTESQWLAGGELSAADIVIYPFMELLRKAEAKLYDSIGYTLMFSFQRFPNITKWTRRIEQLPGYEKTYPPRWEKDKNLEHYIT